MRTALPRAATVLAGVLLTLLCLPSAPSGQAPADGAVSVSFLAIGRDGKAIADLKSDEVQLRVDGRPRTIKALRRIDAAAGDPAAAAALAAPYGTNGAPADAPAAGRTIFLVIHDASFRPGNERLTKQSIDQFLGSLSRADRVSLITAPQATVRTDPTTPDEVRAALARVAGVADQRESDAACRSRDTLEALRSLFSSIAAARTQSTVIFFSSGLSGTNRTTGQMGGASSCDLGSDHFQNVGAAAGAAGAHVYVIQGDLNVTQRSDGLENLAGVVGSQVVVLAAATENPLNKIALETSTSYVATFDPEPSERNGQSHRLELKLTRPESTARAASQLSIGKADGRNAAAKKGANTRDMLREATVYRDLPLRVAGFVSRDAGDKLKLVVVGEPIDPATKLTAAAVGVYDAKGRLSQSTAPPETLATMPVMVGIVVAPGPHRIRLAATDASGRGGTADYEINADLASAGGLKMSGLLLGTNEGGFKPMLEFRNEASAFATFELYGKPPTTMPLKLELAATPDGPALQQVPPSGSGTKDPDRFVISGMFDLSAVAPGDYVVRATVGSADTGGEGRVMRTLRKTK
jgi:hypothetical protein